MHKKYIDKEIENNVQKEYMLERVEHVMIFNTLISDQLAEFLSKPKGSLIARTDVTREINAYIRANKLKDPDNGRKINPDSKLMDLLALKPTDELTYFNLHRYMSQHFQKSVPSVSA